MSKKIANKFEVDEIISHIDDFGRELSEWEIGFIASLIDNPPEEYTQKQVDIIERIYKEKC